ncbi:UDP-N-acetylmuramoyl-L-alanine--D-glutamate ligase [Alicyclobacillus acidiphilus]|uniref:UDP-N-acetylmuramoyl-L-alanine--D-glutamate ligase n=1 Tax=Alicyclobacillus acidiphilus TaxID=182455 RepID=UPI00083394AD|nr:UDP-N-acetylmuramoyl-L-alanine--D-glutamate ligase [Alicyclobacillus acidiphilus]
MGSESRLAGWLSSPGDVLVVGFAKSGAAAATLLHAHGFRVTVTDSSVRPEGNSGVDALESQGVQFVFGGHPDALLDRPWQFVVKNPGIPYQNSFIESLVNRGYVVFTEIEIASWFAKGPIYAITGSNGKTTTTTLVGEMLRASGQDVPVAGNIGTAVSGLVETLPQRLPLVLEVSSFQLMGTWRFRPRIAALLNFYPAHLDYHGSYEAYQQAKWRLFENMRDTDVAVLNHDQPLVRDGAAALRSQIHYFSVEEPSFPNGAAVRDHHVVLVRDGVSRPLLPVGDVSLPGPHNLQNVLAAAAVAQAAGASDEAIASVARSFAGVEHRMELVRELAGVRYYNDSKATNPDATIQALRGFASNLVWIAGGLDRGISFDSLIPDVRQRVRVAILLGQTREKLRDVCQRAGVPDVRVVESLEDAVAMAHLLAQPGDTVLLSPACASWDMFTSFEVRGSMFKEAVHRL